MNSREAFLKLVEIINGSSVQKLEEVKEPLEVIRQSRLTDPSNPFHINTLFEGETLLKLAVNRGDAALVQVLLEEKASPDVVATAGNSALDYAIYCYHTEEIDAHAVSKSLFVARMENDNAKEKTVLSYLAALKIRQQKLVSIMAMMLQHGAKTIYSEEHLSTLKKCISRISKSVPNVELVKIRCSSLLLQTKKEALHAFLYREQLKALDTAYQTFLNFFILINTSANNAIIQVILSFNNGDLFAAKQAITLRKKTVRAALEELKNAMEPLNGAGFFTQSLRTIDCALKLKKPTDAVAAPTVQKKV